MPQLLDTAKYYIIFPTLTLLFFGLKKYKKTDAGRQKWDRIKLKIPMKIGQVVLNETTFKVETLAEHIAQLVRESGQTEQQHH